MRIAFAGRGVVGAAMLRSVLEARHEVVAVLQSIRPQHKKSIPVPLKLVRTATQFLSTREETVEGIARRYRLPVLGLNQMTPEELSPLRALSPELLLLGTFPLILNRALLDLPRIGCVNTHASLLPEYAGPDPYTRVLLANERITGVTFHKMDAGIDMGDILKQVEIAIDLSETYRSLQLKTAATAAAHIPALLEHISAHGLCGVPQDSRAFTYFGNLQPAELFIPWAKKTEDIEPMFRALPPYMYPRFTYKGHVVRLLRASVERTGQDEKAGTVITSRPHVVVATGDGRVRIYRAYQRTPFPSLWPLPWNRPRVGDRVS